MNKIQANVERSGFHCYFSFGENRFYADNNDRVCLSFYSITFLSTPSLKLILLINAKAVKRFYFFSGLDSDANASESELC